MSLQNSKQWKNKGFGHLETHQKNPLKMCWFQGAHGRYSPYFWRLHHCISLPKAGNPRRIFWGAKRRAEKSGGKHDRLRFDDFWWFLYILLVCNTSGWWLNQLIWKICSSKWESSPKSSGWKDKMFELPPPRHELKLAPRYSPILPVVKIPIFDWRKKSMGLHSGFSEV